MTKSGLQTPAEFAGDLQVKSLAHFPCPAPKNLHITISGIRLTDQELSFPYPFTQTAQNDNAVVAWLTRRGVNILPGPLGASSLTSDSPFRSVKRLMPPSCGRHKGDDSVRRGLAQQQVFDSNRTQNAVTKVVKMVIFCLPLEGKITYIIF